MLDLPGLPLLNKGSLIGGCVRLPLRFDSARLQGEVANLPVDVWGNRGGRVGVHNVAQAVFLRGYAPAEGEKPIEDRKPLALLPYLLEFIATEIRLNRYVVLSRAFRQEQWCGRTSIAPCIFRSRCVCIFRW